MPVVKLAFDIDMNDLPAVLEAMRPYQKGIAFAVGLTGGTFNQAALGENQLALDPDQTPEDGQPFNGPGISARKARDLYLGRLPEADTAPEARRPGSPGRGLLPKALAVLREVGTKGMGTKDFHAAMLAAGLDRKSSHNVLYNVQRKGLARQGANKRIYITREGNART